MRRALAILAITPGMALGCGDLSSYSVSTLEFRQLPVAEAVSATLKGTPFKVSFVGEPAGRVSANKVSGPVDRVLGELVKQAGLVYAQAGCVLKIMPKDALVLTIRPGDMIHERVAAWLERNGYMLAWEAGRYRAGAALVIDKPVEAALREVAEVMQSNGIKLSVTEFANRMIRVEEVK